uniref:Transcription factor bZIP5 n=1 Tax=Diospyros kaki TaxID=35925 RepID=A0A3S8T952_DIOKA|nr:transcription factor bZIP5 [Diospyros kaki]
MGFQTMGSNGSGQQPYLQPVARQDSWFSLTLGEIENQLGELGKPLGSLNLDELLKNVWTAEANQINGMIMDSSSVSSDEHQASQTLAKAFNGKTVDEVWREIQQGQKMKNVGEIKGQERQPTLGDITLEQFLIKAGIFAEASSGPIVGVNNVVTPEKHLPQMGLSLNPSFHSISDTSAPGQKRDAADAIEKILDRRLRRKIKNRESAARSRARKQAYHNELVSKISHLEEENMKLRKEKVGDEAFGSVNK